MKNHVEERKNKPSKKELMDLLGNFQHLFFVFPEKDHDRIWIVMKRERFSDLAQFSLELVTLFDFKQRGSDNIDIFTRRAKKGEGMEIIKQTLATLERVKDFQSIKRIKKRVLSNIHEELKKQKKK